MFSHTGIEQKISFPSTTRAQCGLVGWCNNLESIKGYKSVGNLLDVFLRFIEETAMLIFGTIKACQVVKC
jgi:hypothetical protein